MGSTTQNSVKHKVSELQRSEFFLVGRISSSLVGGGAEIYQVNRQEHNVKSPLSQPDELFCLFTSSASLVHPKESCCSFNKRMEVSRRRILLKHLEPARPLRRCIQVDVEPQPLQTRIPNARNMVKQELNSLVAAKTLIDVEQFVQIVSLHKQKQERISYTRDFLIGLASCPEARKRPEHLPEHSIVLSEARDPWQLELGVAQWNGGRGDMES